MKLRLFSNPKFLIFAVVLLIVLFAVSRTTLPQLRPSLQGSWPDRLHQTQPLGISEIQPAAGTGCNLDAAQRQLLLPVEQSCTFTITAATAWLPATRVLSLTLTGGEITAPLAVELRYAVQPLTVEASLVLSTPIGLEVPEGGAVLRLPACAATDGAPETCAVQLGGE